MKDLIFPDQKTLDQVKWYKLMLSLSKTVTFRLNKHSHVDTIIKGEIIDNNDGSNNGTLNRKDRFGSLRSSLRRIKNNIAVRKDSNCLIDT